MSLAWVAVSVAEPRAVEHFTKMEADVPDDRMLALVIETPPDVAAKVQPAETVAES